MKLVTAGGIAAILITVFGWDLLKGYLTKEKLAAYRPPTVAVTTLKAAQSEWTTRISAFGQITASEGVNVTPVCPSVMHILVRLKPPKVLV